MQTTPWIVDALGNVRFADNGMFFDRSARRLGIGTTTPQYAIDAVGVSRMRMKRDLTAGSRSIDLAVDGTATDIAVYNSDLWIRSDLPDPTAAHNIFMLSNRVGVGTTSSALQVRRERREFQPLDASLHQHGDRTFGGWLTSVADNNFFVSSGAMWNGAGWVQKSPDGLAVMAGSGPSGYRVMTRSGCAVGAACPVSTRMVIDYAGNARIRHLPRPSPAHGEWRPCDGGRHLDERIEQEVQGAYRGTGP
ncbi:MAG: hypothetical protein MZV65_00255 [Chromatiales bacterium]|nr:hypothetical protein [Chromatiales bacterium]